MSTVLTVSGLEVSSPGTAPEDSQPQTLSFGHGTSGSSDGGYKQTLHLDEDADGYTWVVTIQKIDLGDGSSPISAPVFSHSGEPYTLTITN